MCSKIVKKSVLVVIGLALIFANSTIFTFANVIEPNENGDIRNSLENEYDKYLLKNGVEKELIN